MRKQYETTLAEQVATCAHWGQVDKSGQPYIEHCRRVSETVLHSDLEDARVVAWLHDVLEDSDVTERSLRVYFRQDIVDAVVAITHARNERNDVYWERVRKNSLACQVKIADIHDNLQPSRLDLLDPKTVNRLIDKYHKALNVLTGGK